jgi:hypothetical protein
MRLPSVQLVLKEAQFLTRRQRRLRRNHLLLLCTMRAGSGIEPPLWGKRLQPGTARAAGNRKGPSVARTNEGLL